PLRSLPERRNSARARFLYRQTGALPGDRQWPAAVSSSTWRQSMQTKWIELSAVNAARLSNARFSVSNPAAVQTDRDRVRTRLPAGAKRIRTLGPTRVIWAVGRSRI